MTDHTGLRSVEVTRDGLLLDGSPFYLLSGCLHYFRWPRDEWPALLRQARWAGLNTIDMVVVWNRHEPLPGAFDFDAEADLGAFLDACAAEGLYAIVRPGPYICAEWENGGLPAWLTAEPQIRLRCDDPAYVAALQRWFARLAEIVAPRQYSRGGNVILIQIENEHFASGVYGHDGHQQTLSRLLHEAGLTLPQYTCMGAMPELPEFRNGWSGIAEKLVETRRQWPQNPMIVSELWSGWFDNWGGSRMNHKTAARLDQTLQRLTAVGASGFSHWMWAGGTNFGFWGGRTVGGDTIHNTTSYDYDAPIDEYGELTDKALVARRHHLFLAGFGAELSRVLADAVPGGIQVITPPALPGRSEAASAPYRVCRAAATAPARWHGFAAAFLQNLDHEGVTYPVFLPDGRRLTVPVEAGSIRPVFANLPLPNGATLVGTSGRILGWFAAADELVVHGMPGEQGRLLLRTPAAAEQLADDGGSAVLHARLPEPTLFELDYWLVDQPRRLQLRWAGGSLLITLLTTACAGRYNGFPQPDEPQLMTRTLTLDLRAEALAAAEVTAPDGWQPLSRPTAQETLGVPYGYSWYRAVWQQDAATELALAAPALSDRARVLLNGNDVGRLGVHPFDGPRWVVRLPLEPGPQELRLLVDNLGRFNYGTRLGEQKGLLDQLYLDGRQEDLSQGWTALWQDVFYAGEAPARARPWAVRADRSDVDLRNFALQSPLVWLLRSFTVEAGRRYQLYLTGDRNSGGCFVNGHALERFSRHRSGGVLQLDITDYLVDGENVLALQILGYSSAAWQVYLLSHAPQPLAAQWSFRAGVTPGAAAAVSPGFWRAQVSRSALPARVRRLALRPRGLEKGQIWWNGFNCGRFWQVGPQEMYKLPVGLLRDDNELLVFSETAAQPDLQLLIGEEL